MRIELLSVLIYCVLAIVRAQDLDDRNYLKSIFSGHFKTLVSTEQESEFWRANAQQQVLQQLDKDVQSTFGPRTAKNLILFVGDGMSIQTITATRAFLGDVSQQMSFERFPHFGLTKTYCVDAQVGDSACTATAILSGVKSNFGTIGVNAQVPRANCELGQNTAYHTPSITEWAQDAGKWAGLVTTARVTHDTPAAVYAHVAHHAWENDAQVKKDYCDPTQIWDTARQLVKSPVGQNLRVILGGGRGNFLNQTMLDEEGRPGWRTDGRNLIEEWLEEKQQRGASAEYVASKQQLMQAKRGRPDYLLGLFNTSHCPYHGDRTREGLTDISPSLSEMTEAAIDVLSRNEAGYFLFVESANIDMAHHDTRARKSLEETAELARAVELARSMTSEEHTLIVVTADHAHTMTINGYPDRNEDILGLNHEIANDGLPYTTLSYANGPGFSNTFSDKGRKDLGEVDLEDPNFEYTATVPLSSATHGGDDVGVHASGPLAHYFTGTYEQSTLPLLMARAAKVGPYQHTQD